MNTPIIEVEGVGKQYQIGANREKYLSLRDQLTKATHGLLNRVKAKHHHVPRTEDFWALKDVSFSVQQGEAVGIIGRNGAGKSTLLKILSQITPPTEGKITFRGRIASLLEVGTGFHPELTGRENIYLNAAILGMTRREVRSRFDAIVEFSNVARFLDTPVKRYSSGMFVRLAFAVAAHLEPDILIVDEVLAVGDAEFQKQCLGKMGEVVGTGRTVLFVSHNMSAMQHLCTRGILLEEGHLVTEGPVNTVVETYASRRQASDMSAELLKRKDRHGSGEVKLSAVRLLDAEAREVFTIGSGQEGYLDFDYISDEPLTSLALAWNLRTEQGQPLFRVSSYDAGRDTGDFPRCGTLRCHVPRWPLVPGTYYLTTEIRIKGTVVDGVPNALALTIAGGDFFGTGRINLHSPLLLDHDWQVLQLQDHCELTPPAIV